MDLDIELIQFYRCETLDDLLRRTAKLCRTIGFPVLSLSWTPAPGPEARMVKHDATIWENYEHHFGRTGAYLKADLARTFAAALAQDPVGTKACQAWKLDQSAVFRLIEDAPADFLLTRLEQQLFGEADRREWSDFFAIPVCRERDRTLFLTAKTPFELSNERVAAISQSLETAANAYRFLYTKAQSSDSLSLTAQSDGSLSSREVECLQWLAAGKTLFEAAIILGISERTLRYHINNARERLGVATTVQAVVAAALTYGFDPRDARRSICASSRPSPA